MTDLLDHMQPADLDPVQEAAYRAATGQNLLPVEEFTGGYAHYEDEEKQRLGLSLRTGLPKEYKRKVERGLKDVIITMPLADKEEFANIVVRMRNKFGYTSTSEVVLDALRYFEDKAVLVEDS